MGREDEVKDVLYVKTSLFTMQHCARVSLLPYQVCLGWEGGVGVSELRCRFIGLGRSNNRSLKKRGAEEISERARSLYSRLNSDLSMESRHLRRLLDPCALPF